jgi:hypothetical protein
MPSAIKLRGSKASTVAASLGPIRRDLGARHKKKPTIVISSYMKLTTATSSYASHVLDEIAAFVEFVLMVEVRACVAETMIPL